LETKAPKYAWLHLEQCRLDYFLVSKYAKPYYRLPNSFQHFFQHHAALQFHINYEQKEAKRGPGFWKFNNSLLKVKEYIERVTKSSPTFLSKYEDLTNKGLFWEMVKMEIRATTIVFAKRKAKQKRDEEKELLQQLSNLQEQLRSNFNDTTKTEIDRVKSKLKKSRCHAPHQS